jgi:hypothetical protein
MKRFLNFFKKDILERKLSYQNLEFTTPKHGKKTEEMRVDK